MEDIVILDGVRTPMAEYNGVFSDISAIDLAVRASREALRRAGTEPGEIEHVIIGNALQTSGDAIYGARHVALKADIPKEVPALTVNRLCGSGFEAIVQAAHQILLGESRVGSGGHALHRDLYLHQSGQCAGHSQQLDRKRRQRLRRRQHCYSQHDRSVRRSHHGERHLYRFSWAYRSRFDSGDRGSSTSTAAGGKQAERVRLPQQSQAVACG